MVNGTVGDTGRTHTAPPATAGDSNNGLIGMIAQLRARRRPVVPPTKVVKRSKKKK